MEPGKVDGRSTRGEQNEVKKMPEDDHLTCIDCYSCAAVESPAVHA